MDHNANHVEEQHGTREVDPIRALKRIDAATWPPERLEWIWKHVKEEKYSADDAGEENASLFLANLFAPCTEHYEYGDLGYICVLNLLAGVNADIHFCMWGDVTTREIYALHDWIYQHLVQAWDIHRMTSYVPIFNTQARRLAIIMGYKYEGCVREMFLKGSKYYDLEVYGLLRAEFERKRGV